MSLRRAGHVQRTPHGEILTLVMQEVQLLGDEIAARGAVPHKGIVIPAIPKPAHHVRKLGRTVVTLTVLEVLGATEIPRFRLVGRGDHVPAGTAMADLIERGILASYVVGFIVAGGGSGDETNPLGNRGDCRQ